MQKQLSLLFGVLVLTLSLQSINASADNVKAKRESVAVSDLIFEVLDKNPELKLYTSQLEAARGGQIAAEEWANPELSSTVGNKHIASGEDGVSWSLAFKQTFEWPGRRRLRKLIADSEVERAELELKRFKSALALEAKIAIFDLLGLEEREAAIKEVTDRYAQVSDVLSKREAPGVNPLLERRIIEATSFALSRKLVEVEIETKKARLRINELRGEPLGEALKIKKSNLELRKAPALNSLIEVAKRNNSELHVKQSELRQQNFKLDLARNERNPAFAVGPYLSNERTGDVETQIGIEVSIPLPIWNRNEGKISIEAARQGEVDASLKLSERRIEREIAESLEIYNSRLLELQKAKHLSIDDFKRAATLADENYRLGAVPIATYVELQKQYLDALEVNLEIKRDALVAKQKLEQLTGVDLDSQNSDLWSNDGDRND